MFATIRKLEILLLITIKGVEKQKNCFEQQLSDGYKEMAHDLPRELEAQLWTNSYLLNDAFLATVKRPTMDNPDLPEKFVCELLIALAEAKNLEHHENP